MVAEENETSKRKEIIDIIKKNLDFIFFTYGNERVFGSVEEHNNNLFRVD